MNLPNRLTLVRIVLSFLLVFLLLLPGLPFKGAALCVFVAAALTDWWDGRIARRRGLISDFGALMDPIADKVLVLSAFGAFVLLHVAPGWMVLLIAARELLITGLRLIALAKGKVLPAEAAGKWKATAQMVVISITLLFLVAREAYPPATCPVGNWLSLAGAGLRALMLGVVVLTVTSGISFLWHNRKQIVTF